MDSKLADKIALVHIQSRKVLLALNHGSNKWYLPGGGRELGESDQDTLIREVSEELSVDIVPESIERFNVFEAQAHGSPEGTMVKIAYYTALFIGEAQASSEIAEIRFFSHNQKDMTSAPSQLLLDDLKSRDLID